MKKTARFMTVTPDQATTWLEKNTSNRKVRGWWVSALKLAILRGEWKVTHQGVAFTASGRLLDGQHRLMAIVAADKPCEMLVVTGLDESAFMVIDAGVKRSVSDLTGLDKRSAEVARLAVQFTFPGSASTSSQLVLDVANACTDELHSELLNVCRSTIRYYSSAPMRLAAISLVMNGYDKEQVFSQYANLVYQNFNEMSPLAQSLVRQVNRDNLVSAKSIETFVRGFKTMNPKNSALNMLKVSDAEVKGTLKNLREMILTAVESTQKLEKAA